MWDLELEQQQASVGATFRSGLPTAVRGSVGWVSSPAGHELLPGSVNVGVNTQAKGLNNQ